MRELSEAEIDQVSGGLGPLAIIGIDLALNGLLIDFDVTGFVAKLQAVHWVAIASGRWWQASRLPVV